MQKCWMKTILLCVFKLLNSAFHREHIFMARSCICSGISKYIILSILFDGTVQIFVLLTLIIIKTEVHFFCFLGERLGSFHGLFLFQNQSV